MIILRISSPSPEFLEACKAWVDPSKVEASWRVGESAFGGRKATSNGLNLALGEDDSRDSSLAAAQIELKSLSPNLQEVVLGGGNVTLDIGMEIEPLAPKSVNVSPPMLALLTDIGAALVVSGYPCDKDDEEEQGH